MGVAVGIDLGTTNSCVAVVQGQQAKVIENSRGNRIHPSVISFHPNGETLTGQLAKDRLVIDPSNTIYSFKRLIGRDLKTKEMQELISSFPFEVIDKNGIPILKTRQRETTLPEVSAIMLKSLRGMCTETYGVEINDCIITVPANFTDVQRASTKIAGRIAGFNVLRILNEPTAAALAYGFGSDKEEKIAIYDFGGGTFDITIIELMGDVFEVLATAGDTFLGGDDFDSRIVKDMLFQFKKENGFDPGDDPVAMQRLRSVAERAKCQLSAIMDVQATLRELARDKKGRNVDFSFSISRDRFEQLTDSLVERSLATCEEAMSLAKLSFSDLDNVVLVGGTTRIPKIRRCVEELFRIKPRTEINPDEVVAIGAAINAFSLTGEALPDHLKPIVRAVGPDPFTRRSMAPGSPAAPQAPATKSPLTTTGSMPLPKSNDPFADLPARKPVAYDDPFGEAARPARPVLDDPFAEKRPPAAPKGKPQAPITPPVSAAAPETDDSWDNLPGLIPDSQSRGADLPKPVDLDGGRTDLPGLTSSGGGIDLPTPVASGKADFDAMGDDSEDLALDVDIAPPPPRTSGFMNFGSTDDAGEESLEYEEVEEVEKAGGAFEGGGYPPIIAPSVEITEEIEEIEEIDDGAGSSASAFDGDFGKLDFDLAPPPLESTPPPSMQPRRPQALTPGTAADLPPIFAATAPVAAAARMPERGEVDLPRLKDQVVGGDGREAVQETHAAFVVPIKNSSPAVLLDVTPRALGVATAGGYCDIIIERNAAIPIEQSRCFSTSRNDQTEVTIEVYQGESRKTLENTLLGRVHLTDIRPALRGEIVIRVTFEIDTDGILNVRAANEETGAAQTTSIRLSGGLDEDQISSLVEKYADNVR